MTATATKTTLKKGSQASSNFIAFIPSHSIHQTLTIFWSWILTGCIEVQEKKKEVAALFTSSTKHETCTQQWRQRNSSKKHDASALSCCFVNLVIVFLLFSLNSPSLLLKLPNMKCGNCSLLIKLMVRTGAITLIAVPFQLSQGKLRAILYFSGKLSESQWSKLSVNLYEKNLYYLVVTILIHYPVSSHFS